MRKKSKSYITKLQDKIWELCKQIIRAKYGDVCYTCGQSGLVGLNWHTGHMIPKAALGAYLKYDLRLLRPQCFNCNINLGGNGAVFIEKMRKVEGNRYVNKILSDRNISVKAVEHYEMIYEKYKKLVN